MNVWQWILTTILFIVSFGLLITIHEFGHFSMAKLFKVYCQEFSIGFGPKLLKVRKKGHETYFSIRAIPLGGYVSMYGEGVELEDGINIPPERSLEGISRPKKALILSAGIILNAVLALLLFAISNIAFPVSSISSEFHVSETSLVYNLEDGDKISPLGPTDDKKVTIYDEISVVGEDGKVTKKMYSGVFYILNDDILYNDYHYVLCWYPNTNASEPKLSNSLYLFLADSSNEISELPIFKSWTEKGVTLKYYPNVASKLNPFENTIVPLTFNVKDKENNEKEISFELTSELLESGSYQWKDLGVSNKIVAVWLPFSERVQDTFSDFAKASSAVFQGLGMLFTGGIQNLSGVVGIFTMSAEVLQLYTFNYYLYFWGLISVNLAIFNLLPFPGLDGWALLVTCIEGGVNAVKRKEHSRSGSTEPYVEWKIPNKVKTIVSSIGLILLFALMFVIVGFDIARIIKG